MSMKSNAHVICFDFDGTVADTMPFLTELAVNIICKHYGIDDQAAKAKYLETTGLSFELQLDTIFPDHPSNSVAVQEFEERKRANYLHFPPVHNMQHVLRTLKRKSYAIAISSGTLQDLLIEYLRAYELPYDIALGYQPNFKKGKEHFEFIQSKFAAEPEHLCYIGDSLNDYRLARANHIRFIAKLGLFDADAFLQLDPNIAMIRDMEELLPLLHIEETEGR